MTDHALQKEARRLEVITLFALILVTVGLVARAILLPVLAAFREAVPGSWEFWSVFAPALVPALPAFILLGAIDASRKLFGRLARGELFSDAVGRGVREIGGSLVFAAAAMAVIVPWLEAWIDGRYGFGGIKLDSVSVVLAIVGAALLLLGRLLKRAGAMQSELERFV